MPCAGDASGFQALPWTQENSFSVDWTCPDDVLANMFTFRELLAAHPALDAYYSGAAAAPASLAASSSEAAASEEKKRLSQLFLSPSTSSHSGESLQEKQQARRQLLTWWADQKLLTLRDARWCRGCGRAGHTLRTCHLSSTTAAAASNGALAIKRERDDDAEGGDDEQQQQQHHDEDASSLTSPTITGNATMNVLEKFRRHQQHLERERLIAEKTKGRGGQAGKSSLYRRTGGYASRNPGAAEDDGQELFSDERRRGIISRLDPVHGIGFIQTSSAGPAGGGGSDVKFLLDRADFGMKRVGEGDRVTYKTDITRDYPQAIDVRAETPSITPADLVTFTHTCRTSSNTVRLLSTLLSHPAEWREAVILMYNEFKAAPPPSAAASLTLRTAPTWLTQAQTFIEVATFHVNQEPIHKSILAAFLQLLRSPVEAAAKKAPESAAGTTAAAPLAFFPTVFSALLTHLRHILHAQLAAATAAAAASSNTAVVMSDEQEEEVEKALSMAEEATSLVILMGQYTNTYHEEVNQLLRDVLAGTEQVLRAVGATTAQVLQPLMKRLKTSCQRLTLLDSLMHRAAAVAETRSSTASGGEGEETVAAGAGADVQPIPPSRVFCIPPPAEASLFNPHRLPIHGSPQPGDRTSYPSPYESAEAFVRSHAVMLRADTFEYAARVLAAACFRLPDHPPSEETTSDVAHTPVYTDVTFLGYVLPKDRDYSHPRGFLFRIAPSQTIGCGGLKALQGTCVCFTTALDETVIPSTEGEVFWGVVTCCDATLLRSGVVCVEPCSEADGAFDGLLEKLERNHAMRRGDRCMMVETPVFFAGYVGIMNALNSFLGPLAMPLPLASQLLQRESKAVSRGQLLSCVPAHCVQALKEIIHRIRTSFSLDEGQQRVMDRLPQDSVLLVQGPPGTGKSFIGCRVVEVYVRYKGMIASGELLQHISVTQLAEGARHHHLNSGGGPATTGGAAAPSPMPSILPRMGPVVVITYKNHALDEFLVDLLHSSSLWRDAQPLSSSNSVVFPDGKRLVRIGGSSKEAQLDAFNLTALMREQRNKTAVQQYRDHVVLLHQRLDRLCKEMRHLENGRVPRTYFDRWLTTEQLSRLPFHEREEWLSGGRCLDPNAEKVEKTFFKTLLRTALDTLLEATQQQASAGQQQQQEGAEKEEDDVHRSVFQLMRLESEERDFNNTLHTTVLSPEAVHLARHPPSVHEQTGFPAEAPTLQSLWSLAPRERHYYYVYLIQKSISEKAQQCLRIHSLIASFLRMRNHELDVARLAVLEGADVVGLTTTGCALNQNLLRSLRPSVLVVEEAAEVLESQLLACMTESLRQLILIGDHYQLQPKVDTFGYEKVNRMNLSLFERLSENIPVIRLTEQRRMHPDISTLIRPFYHGQPLIDHPVVLTRPLVTVNGEKAVGYLPGLQKRVFFWRHRHSEEDAMGGSRSKVNLQEVEMALQLVTHLTRQGIRQLSITIITPYLGQCRLLRRTMRLSHFSDVRVSTVDLFQGDENDVIILSLVRTARLTDFLRMRNRLVVSASRARFAMVMMGSDRLLRQCSHWAQLLATLEKAGCVGDKLPVTSVNSRGERVSWLLAARASSKQSAEGEDAEGEGSLQKAEPTESSAS